MGDGVAEQALHQLLKYGWRSCLQAHLIIKEVAMKRFGFICVGALLLTGLGMISGWAMDQKGTGPVPEVRQAMETKSATPTSRFLNVKGTLREIQGNVYVLEGASDHQLTRVEIGKDTAFPNGQKEPGQVVHALISSNDGHALIIR